MFTLQVVERFWAKVDKKSPLVCWPWIAALDGKNYGMFWLDGRTEKAPRVAFRLAYGDIPEGMWILHRCDNPRCVNPKHLYAGTIMDNTADMWARGRCPTHRFPALKGQDHVQAKLTDMDVRQIRSDYAKGVNQGVLGARYGVHRSAIGAIVRRQNWRHIE